MRFIDTTAGGEQTKINTPPENAPIILATTSPCEAQASPVKNRPTSSPIVLTTMPYPGSGPGGPSLTSRKH